ncbi:MAG: tripartite tricarboxylate transporter family receptor [Hyphomicrobiales bacterium]|nr:tripartite tricarboxylate transporter family receptor [Hyphomicrobiales bacterium]
MSGRTSRIGSLALASGLLALTAPAGAQSPADFYRGKNVNVLIGVGVGGEYDLHARVVARHIGRNLPGNPNFVPQNMTGAGGAKMVAYLADVAPKDGTNIGMIANNFPAMQAAGLDVIRFDLGKFNWIGSISPTVETMTAWKTAGVSTIQETQQKEIIAGASGKGAITYSFPSMLNEFVGTKFKIVPGYPGGNEINLAMERGEVQARNNTWSSWKVTKPEWIKNGDIKILVYAGPAPRDLPGVPSVTDLVKTDDDKRTVELIISGTRLGRPLAFAGGVPADRVAAMRAAFDATMQDPEFVKEANQLKIEIDPVRGEDMQKVVADVLSTPKHLAQRAKAIIE